MPMKAMRLTCPNCSTEYDVPDAALGARRRKLRCGLCAHEWRVPLGAEESGVALAPELPAWPVDTRVPMDEPAWQTAGISEAAEQEFIPNRVVDPDAETDAADADGLPAFLSEGRLRDDALLDPVATAETSRFAELIYAARKNAANHEAEALSLGARPSRRNTALKVIALLVLVAVAVLLEHKLVVRFVPASATLFEALGLK
jgi:predicted Zn finger-like uncharacterized protein